MWGPDSRREDSTGATANTKVTEATAEFTEKVWIDIFLWKCLNCLESESRRRADYPKLRDLDVTSVSFVFAVAVLPGTIHLNTTSSAGHSKSHKTLFFPQLLLIQYSRLEKSH
jgi:hypothetical protein